MNVVAFCETVYDSVGHTICNFAKEHSASVIVIGQRGSGVFVVHFLEALVIMLFIMHIFQLLLYHQKKRNNLLKGIGSNYLNTSITVM